MRSYIKGFSIIELLLVLTVVSIFLGAVFIGYRTIKARTNEDNYGYQGRVFVEGLKDYYSLLGAYPNISCTDYNSWYSVPSGTCDWNSHPISSPANCCALMHFIGPWASSWTYISYTNAFVISTPTSAPIPVEYIKAVANEFVSSGLQCKINTLNGDYGYLTCSVTNIPTST